MTGHFTIDSQEPDPSLQKAWPSRRRGSDVVHSTARESSADARTREQPPPPVIPQEVVAAAAAKKRLTTWGLITLSVAMAGAQIAWTVELGYGNPFLLSLGLSEQVTSLVWLAGPISGLIAQPLIGAISDSNTSKYRRRYWVSVSTAVLVASMLALAYCEVIASVLVNIFSGLEDWDPKRAIQVNHTAIGIAVTSFYFLDFALNALQASLRNLLLDITPPDQLNSGNAWHGRMTHAGNIIGFGFGFLPLEKMPLFKLLGGDQFRKFCVLALSILIGTVWVTCWSHEETARQDSLSPNASFLDVLKTIYQAMLKLPKAIRRVCYVQVFAFMGWFPFLFFATTYVGQIMAYENQKEPDADVATRSGEFALLLYSIVAIIAGTVLPHLAGRDRRLLAHDGDEDEDTELSRLRGNVRQWKAEAIRQGKPLTLPTMPFLLRNIWTAALLLFTVLTMSTFFVSTVFQATVVISLIGICWAVASWAPFAIIFLKEMDAPADPRLEYHPSAPVPRPLHARASSTPAFVHKAAAALDTTPLLRVRRRSFDEYDTGLQSGPEREPVAGGTILGIHNLAIVLPQFIVSLVASVIFKLADTSAIGDPEHKNTYLGHNGVAWVLRFGGLCTMFGAIIARMVPPTRTEKDMRRRLAEMRVIQEDEA